MQKIVTYTFNVFLKLQLFPYLFSLQQVKRRKQAQKFSSLWTSVWKEQAYMSEEDSEKIIAHYNTFTPYSIDYIVRFLYIWPVGIVRIISKNPFGLPTLNDFTISPKFSSLGMDEIIEVTLLSVKKVFRQYSHVVALLLIRQVYKYTIHHGISGIVVAADRRLWFLLKRILLLPFTQIGDSQLYEGSVTFPGYLHIPDWEKEVKKRNFPRNLLEKSVERQD